jgi:deoxyribonuclease-4
MLNIGCHLSSSKGFTHMGEQALSINANTFQFFTRNPRGSKAKDIDDNDVKGLLKIMDENKFAPVLGHAPYTLNPGSANQRTREFALEVLKADLVRMEYLPNNLYNFHPGSHVGQGIEKGIELISEALNLILTADQTTMVLIETMSGKGSEIGSTFEEIKEIIKKVKLDDKIGVCLDTCHIYDAGYDF